MINRRHFIQGTAGLVAGTSFALPALADWKADYKELVYAVVPDENATGVEKRYEAFVNYLSKELGVPVKFIGTGETIADIEPFNPVAFARELVEG